MSMITLQILGTGCSKCQKLAENAKAAAEALGLQYQLVKVTDLAEIGRLGVMITPALAVDGNVKCAGRVPDVEFLKKMLSEGDE
jgi:small redox-active disulfide protein 2